MRIEPARIVFGADGVPRAPDFDDVYHARVGAQAQARHVFLAGNGLPERWRGRARFTILETGFGLGNNFLAAWQAWRDDPAHGRRLVFVGIDKHPPRHDALARAHAASPWPALAAELVAAWPPLTPDIHLLDFDAGTVRLLLAFGDVADVLPELDLAADAVFIDGFAPAQNPAMWEARVLKAIGRRCAAGATAATWSVARPLRDGLAAAGFEVGRAPGIGGKREITVARFAPRFPLAPRPAPAADAVVIGAGLAGAFCARALADEGFAVTVLERMPRPAGEGSSQPGGLYHGTVHADDGPHARLLRAAALLAARVHGPPQGLLRLGPEPALIERHGLPPDWVQALDREAASALAGVPLPGPAWFYPGGGWVAPAAAVEQALRGLALRSGAAVERLARDADGWRAEDAAGGTLARAGVVVLANAGDAARLAAPFGFDVSLQAESGRTSGWRGAPTPLARPVAGDGYALPLPDGLLCGASAEGDPRNFERLLRLTGLQRPPGALPVGHAGVRWHAPDRLPVAGALALDEPPRHRAAAATWPRHAGLYVCTALGGRGVTWAPLLGRVIAAHASGSAMPLARRLLDAIDPVRWRVRARRRVEGSFRAV